MMKDSQPTEIRLENYRVPAYLIDKTRLHFELGEAGTLVKTNLQLRRNPECEREGQVALELQGTELLLKRLVLDGKVLGASDYQVLPDALLIPEVPDEFELECVTLIHPETNSSLEGLYRSAGMFCTQCEAEGFRKITYYLDRPDVMSIFTTTLVADKNRYPVLLSNGNDIERGDMGNNRHWVTWHDPFKKPAYLFALVAGDLEVVEDRFVTGSGRQVELQIFVEKVNLDKCSHAMRSLKKAMAWDEQVYGREYDLDKFMIVAVNDFNMGAMENKGLNIFNSSCALAKPETATDEAYQRIEGVVAHEYFHNWSGNRVTCRDWFQLSLKEGFTVFRDQEFSADMNSPTVKRIDDVAMLRTLQFAEDAGPMAHPVRPEAYMEISNFYTVTIYEKGAELVRMMYQLLGQKRFRKGTDLYFSRHDGQAVTTDDFITALTDASGVDLTQFKRWYSQVGTPHLEVSDHYDLAGKTYSLTVRQLPPTNAGGASWQPLHLPLNMALLNAVGDDITARTLELKKLEQTFVFEEIVERPVPSLLRGFSAPVKLHYPYSRQQRAFLMAHDRDGFNRWDAGQHLALDIIQENIKAFRNNQAFNLDRQLTETLGSLLAHQSEEDPALLARLLSLPSEAWISELAERIDVEAIHCARQFVRRQLAQELKEELLQCYHANTLTGDYRPDAQDMAKRSLRNTCLHYLMLLEEPQILTLCREQLQSSANMTDSRAALTALVHSGYTDESQQALDDFYAHWKHDPQVVDQWFAVQATRPSPDTLYQVRALCKHPAFNLANPNKVRALVGSFAHHNMLGFHLDSGAGYSFLADCVMKLDALNPQIAARIVLPLTRWRKYANGRDELMHQELVKIRKGTKLSKDLFEVVNKSLK